jgi:GNAT superfamily N-acetyltransferase
MSLPAWREEPIAKRHDHGGFDCGASTLNDFLKEYARQSHEQGGAKTFVAVAENDDAKVLGFYTIAPFAIAHDAVPASMTKGVARHEVPAFKLARLAVDVVVAGHGLGGQLLLAATQRCLRFAAEGGGILLLIDEKSPKASSWYQRFGAEPVIGRPLILAVSLRTFATALKVGGHL